MKTLELETDAMARLAASDCSAARSKFRTIVADPPWAYKSKMAANGFGYRDKDGNRIMGTAMKAAPMPYPTMSVDEICALPVRDFAEDDSHLYLWTTQRSYNMNQTIQKQMTTTDNELKQLLAKMLPETVQFFCKRLTWMHDYCGNFIEDGAREVGDTELLHLTNVIAHELRGGSHYSFERHLKRIMQDDAGEEGGHQLTCMGSWKQRTTALAEVKRVTL